jgi:hypothetical protein
MAVCMGGHERMAAPSPVARMVSRLVETPDWNRTRVLLGRYPELASQAAEDQLAALAEQADRERTRRQPPRTAFTRSNRPRPPAKAPSRTSVIPGTGAELAGDRPRVLPVLFHLMWRQRLAADLAVPLGMSTVVRPGGTS